MESAPSFFSVFTEWYWCGCDLGPKTSEVKAAWLENRLVWVALVECPSGSYHCCRCVHHSFWTYPTPWRRLRLVVCWTNHFCLFSLTRRQFARAPPPGWTFCHRVLHRCSFPAGALAPCGLRGCKNGPAPFPGRMSYKATKPGLVSVLYLRMFFIVLLFIRAPFYVLLVFIVCVLSFGCSNFVVITCQVIG